MTEYAFPFEKIKKDSKLIIYGLGRVGEQLIEAVEKTEYCNLVCILDKNAAVYKAYYKQVRTPEYIARLRDDEYDTVLIAIANNATAQAAKSSLRGLGVPEYKIQLYSVKYSVSTEIELANLSHPDDGSGIYRLALVAANTLGDTLLSLLPVAAFRKLIPENLVIDVYALRGAWESVPYIDRCYPITKPPDNKDYDTVISLHAFTSLLKYSPEKTKRFSEGLYCYFEYVTDFMRRCFPSPAFAMRGNLTQYFLLTDTHRVMQNNLCNALPYRRDSIPSFFLNPESYAVLSKNGLAAKEYITICVDSNPLFPSTSKEWPADHYITLMRMIHENHKDIKIVLTGSSLLPDIFDKYVFVNLSGKTRLSEICCLLKHSLLHIGTEGGLVHLNHALGGKSCCLFGPTNIKLLAYEENINLKSNTPPLCKDGCEFVCLNKHSWHCLYESEHSLCMQTLLPGFVYENIADYLGNARFPAFELCETIPRNKLADLFNAERDCALVGRTGDAEVRRYLPLLKQLTVYNADLSEGPTNPEAPINLLYAKKSSLTGVNAEYGTVYNVPAKAEHFDLVINFELTETEYPAYALLELFRIVKQTGTVAVLNKNGSFDLYRSCL